LRAPARLKTKSGHRPRARLHATWSPIGQREKRTTAVRVVGVLLGLVMAIGLAADAYAESFLGSLPDIKGLDASNLGGDFFITDRNGKLLADVTDQGNRKIYVHLTDVAPVMSQATVAIEDKNFWSNPGFDPEAIVRTALSNFRSRTITGGASTITQQLAKQLFLTPDQTYERKAKELVLAYELTKAYSKDQILELYLNRSYYGAQSYGVQAAAQTYFHKDAKTLDLAQAAMLAGLPQAPAQWSPIVNPEASKARQREVLNAMVRLGYITPEDLAKAYDEKLDIYGPVTNWLAPHFVDYVLKELEQLGFKPGQEQLVVRTTLDLSKQTFAEKVVRDNLNANKGRDPGGLLSSSLISMDPKTGQIVAMVGSPDYNGPAGKFNFTTTYRNPGSSVKPFTYGAVINARKATMDTPIADSPSPLVINQGAGQEPYKVFNYDHGTHGVQPLRVALASSLNIPAVKSELSIGVPAVLDFWRNLGLRPWDASGDPNGPVYNYGAALTLGGYPITTLQEVNALSVYADMGVYHPAEALLSVTDVHGQALYQANPDASKRQAIDPGVAFIIASILSDDNNRALIFGHNSPLHMSDHTSAAKTGTTENFKDALTIGFTPDIATVVWVGDILDLNHTMYNGSDGVFVAAPAWHTYMEGVLSGVPDKWYPPPSDVVKGPGNSWYLNDTQKVDKLPNDNPTPIPTPPDYGIPPDPGAPRAEAVPTPTPSPSHGPSPHP
jgi:membrane peptidoglycan carboxypeptidase